MSQIVLILAVFGHSEGSAQTDSLYLQLQSGMDLQKERKHEEALEVFLKALDINRLSSTNDSIVALLHHRAGISYYRLRNRNAAIQSWTNAINVRLQFLPPNHIDIVKTHINIANAHLTLDQYRNANNSLTQALELLESQEVKDLHNLGRVYESLGLNAKTLGDYESSIQFLQQSYGLKKELYEGKEPWELIDITTRLFDLYKDIGDADRMLHYAQLSLQYAELTPNDGNQYYFDLANSHNNLGIAYSSNLDTEKAIHYYEASLTLNARFNEREDYLGINYNNLISQYNRLGDFSKALDYAEQAKAIFSADPTYIDFLAETYVEEGDVHANSGKLDSAWRSYDAATRALVIDREPLKENDKPENAVYISGSQYTLMDALYKGSRCQVQLGQMQEAKEGCDQLISLVLEYRKRISDRESKKYLLEYAKQFFELGVEIQYELYAKTGDVQYVSSALNILDQSKSSILYDALSQNALSSTSEAIEDLMDQEKALVNDMINLEFDLLEADLHERDEFRETLLARRLSVSQIRDSIFQFVNKDFDRGIGSSNLNIEEVQSLLGKGEVLIQYFVGEIYVYAISVTDDDIEFIRIDATSSISDEVTQYLKVLRDYGSAPMEYVHQGYNIYEKLLGAAVQDHQYEKLFIIPDDIIAYIPFEALPKKSNDVNSYADVEFVIQSSSVRYASSYSIYEFQQESNAPIAPELFAGMSADYKNVPGFVEMQHANAELVQVQAILGGDIFKNEDASKANYLEMHSQHRVVHLSLHGVVDEEIPSLSYLQFPASENLTEERLYAAEVYNLDINNEMLVLSACETGLGQLVKGEGILSLAHAFAYGGARSIVMSLWQIPSVSTSTIMEGFYRQLEDQSNKDQALRSAKLEYMSSVKAPELLHPFYWSSLILYGNQDAIVMANGMTPMFLCVLGAIIVLMLLHWIFRRSSSASTA